MIRCLTATLLGHLALAAPATASSQLRGFDARPRTATEIATGRGLELVDAFLEVRPRQTGGQADGPSLLQTYGPELDGGGGPCGTFCTLPFLGRFDVYDSAASAIYWTYRGRLGEARRVVDAFVRLLLPKDDVAGKYSYGPEHGLELPPGRRLTLLASAYTNVSGEPGVYSGPSVADGSVDTGNNAWAALALAHFSVFAQQPCYEMVARNVLRALVASASCHDRLKGLMGRLPPHAQFYRSTEHNVDVFALSRMLGEPLAEAQAQHFVQAMYGHGPGLNHTYAMGTSGGELCNTTSLPDVVAADAQFWNVLADVDPDPERQAAAMLHALRPASKGGLLSSDDDVIGPVGDGLEGVRFTSEGSGVQWENTAATSLVLEHFRRRWRGRDAGSGAVPSAVRAAEEVLPRLTRSLLRLLSAYGALPGSVRGGNNLAYVTWKAQNASGLERLQDAWEAWKQNVSSADVIPPGGSATGIGWTYMRFAHTAATAWTGLALMGVNPYEPPVTLLHRKVGSDGFACNLG